MTPRKAKRTERKHPPIEKLIQDKNLQVEVEKLTIALGLARECAKDDAATISGLREQIKTLVEVHKREMESDDLQFGKQRERLIRLTEIKNSMSHFIQTYWEISEGTTAIELDGTMWMKFHHAENADHWVNNLEADIAALEVDTALPKPEGAK